MLSKCRLAALWTASKMARSKIGRLDVKFKNECPLCGVEGEGETVQHIILSCSQWQVERECYLKEMLDSIVQLPSEGQLILILGGEYGGQRFSNWLPIQGDVQTSPMPSLTVEGPCGAFRVAQYLQKIAGRRQSSLRQFIRCTRVENSSQPSQGPIGYGEPFTTGQG